MTMYCEARTTTGLGCDSLGIDQCKDCVDMDCALISRNAGYMLGLFGPRYPVPAIVPERKYETYAECWSAVHTAARWFNRIGSSNGMNWAWYHFLTENDAIGFDTWCQRNNHETRGVYPAWERGPISVRYR
jgi:hypothetical protein